MRRKLLARALIIPLLVAFLLLVPLLGAAVIGEHRYANVHPAYVQQLLAKILGENDDARGKPAPSTCPALPGGVSLERISTETADDKINILVIPVLTKKNIIIKMRKFRRKLFQSIPSCCLCNSFYFIHLPYEILFTHSAISCFAAL